MKKKKQLVLDRLKCQVFYCFDVMLSHRLWLPGDVVIYHPMNAFRLNSGKTHGFLDQRHLKCSSRDPDEIGIVLESPTGWMVMLFSPRRGVFYVAGNTATKVTLDN